MDDDPKDPTPVTQQGVYPDWLQELIRLSSLRARDDRPRVSHDFRLGDLDPDRFRRPESD